MRLFAVGAVVIAAVVQAAEAQTREQGRTLYAIAETGPEYCPGIERRWLVMGTITRAFDYRPEDDRAGLRAERQRLFEAYRSAPRAAVCEMLMREFGPGADFEMFQFK